MRTFIFVLSLLMAGGVAAAEPKSFAEDFDDALAAIAARRGVTKEETQKQARILLADSLCFPVKGGVAIIRDAMYVLAREKNGVIAGQQTTYGADWRTPEIFVFADQKFVGRITLPPGGEKDVVVTLFTPDRVRFFDWKALEGGYYRRSTP